MIWTFLMEDWNQENISQNKNVDTFDLNKFT